MSYPLLHSPPTYSRPRLLIVAEAEHAPGLGDEVAAATARGLRTFVVCTTRGVPLPGSGLTHAVVPDEEERAIRAACSALGAYRLDVVGYLATRDLDDLVARYVHQLRPDELTTHLPTRKAAS